MWTYFSCEGAHELFGGSCPTRHFVTSLATIGFSATHSTFFRLGMAHTISNIPISGFHSPPIVLMGAHVVGSAHLMLDDGISTEKQAIRHRTFSYYIHILTWLLLCNPCTPSIPSRQTRDKSVAATIVRNVISPIQTRGAKRQSYDFPCEHVMSRSRSF